MKKSELKEIIREEIQKVLNENAPKYKKGDKLAYRGTGYTVIEDDGYVVTVEDKNGKTVKLNHNQLKQGMREEEMPGSDNYYTYYYINRPYSYDPDFEEFVNVTVKAPNKDMALEKIKKYKGDKNWKFSSENNPSDIEKYEEAGEEYYEEIS